MDSETLALAAEVATALDQSAHTDNIASKSPSLLTPITLYRTGRILFACIHPSDANIDDTSNAPSISTLFDKLLSSLHRDYVRNALLHELHVGYANLIVSFASAAASSYPDTSSLTSLMASASNYASKPLAECTAHDVIEATQSLCGIYMSSNTACRYCGSFETANNGDESSNGSSTTTANELDIAIASFSWVYEYLLLSLDASLGSLKECVLTTISRILTHGIVLPSTSTAISDHDSEDERLSAVMNTIQRIQSSVGEYSCVMGDMLHLEEEQHNSRNDSFLRALNEQFSDGPQLQYFKAMLRGFPRSNSKPKSIATTTNIQPNDKALLESSVKQPPQTMLDVQINHVQSVLPDLGDGFIEEALKFHNDNVERTLDALLSGNLLHPTLSSLPRNLPRKLKDLPEQYTANVNMHRGATAKEDGKEHVQRQKQYVKEAERQAEEEAYLVENVSRALGGLRVQGIQSESTAAATDDFGVTGSEYNDDYDDQYDGVGDDGGMAGGIGGLDDGLYDVDVHNVHQRYDRGGAKNDQDMWRQYNKLIKDVDSESQYWVSSLINA